MIFMNPNAAETTLELAYPSARTVEQTALGENLGESSVPGQLLPEYILWSNSGRKATRADYFQISGILA